MKIASITLFCREHFRLEAWKRFYEDYREDVYLHVIVNNGDEADTALLKDAFPESVVLFSETNNMMASYNLALREIFTHPEVDAVAQIVNDIRLSKGAFRILYRYLFSNPSLAMVSPILLKKDSEIVDSFGCTVNPKNFDFVHNDPGRRVSDFADEDRTAGALPAGIILARRDRYEQFGFQDEALMMYADEIDMAIRVVQLGYSMGVTSRAKAWHQHVNRGGKAQRSPMAGFFMGRNPVYIARKYYGGWRVLRVFLRRLGRGMDEIRSALMHRKSVDFYRFGWAMMKGAFAGLRM